MTLTSTSPPKLLKDLRILRFWVYIGCVLMQKGKVIVYVLRQLNRHECDYPIHERELEAIVLTLKILRHYLFGEKCHIFMDNESLRYIFFYQKGIELEIEKMARVDQRL